MRVFDAQGGRQRRTDRIVVPESESQPIDLVLVQWIVIQHTDIHLPFGEVVGFDELDAGREMLFHLYIEDQDGKK